MRKQTLLKLALAILAIVGGVDLLRSVKRSAYRFYQTTVLSRKQPLDDTGKLVLKIGYQPKSICNSLETPIEFDVGMRLDQYGEKYVYAPDDLEFRLSEYHNHANEHWKVVEDWQPWPLPAYRASQSGTVALQIDVRLKNNPDVIDTHWLNQFSFLPHEATYTSSLLRTLIAAHFDVINEDKLQAILADELRVIVVMLHSNLQRMEHVDLVKKLRQLSCVADVVSNGPHSERIRLASGPILDWNSETDSLHEEGRDVVMGVGANPSPEFAEVARLCKSLPNDAIEAAATAFFVQSGYYYGTPPEELSWSVRDNVASCQQLSLVVRSMLAATGATTKLVSLSCPRSGASHILVHVISRESKTPLLLDPTLGCVYRCGLDELTPDHLPAAILLPHHRDIGGCTLASLIDSSTTVVTCDTPIKHIYPVQYNSVSVIRQPAVASKSNPPRM